MLANLTRMASILGTPLEEINWQYFRIKLVKSLLNQLRLRGLAPSTINATLAAVRGVVRQAWKLELIGDSDYLQIMEIKGVKKRDKAAGRIPTFKDLTLLLNSCAEDNNGALGDRDAAMLALIVSLQLTPSNMVKLNISDYDHSAKALRVHEKGGKEREITICDIGAWEALSTWLKRRGAKPGHLLCHVNKSGKVIIKALSSEAIYKALRSRMSKAKVVPFPPRELRRILTLRS
jgi:site-specific recombinase XerC